MRGPFHNSTGYDAGLMIRTVGERRRPQPVRAQRTVIQHRRGRTIDILSRLRPEGFLRFVKMAGGDLHGQAPGGLKRETDGGRIERRELELETG